MPTRRALVVGSVLGALVAAGWLGVIALKTLRAYSVGFAATVLGLVAAGFAARFARDSARRAWWYGFAVFGIFALISTRPGLNEPLLAVGVDRLGDLIFGARDNNGYRSEETSIGAALRTFGSHEEPGNLVVESAFVVKATKLLAVPIFGFVGGLLGVHLARKARPSPIAATGESRVPRLGLAAMIGIGVLVGLAFVLISRPDVVTEGWNHDAPGCDAGLFALYQVEALIVLFAAMEARFGAGGCRPWWLGFALFGGTDLLMLTSGLTILLPTAPLGDWFFAAFERFVTPRAAMIVQAGGMIFNDNQAEKFLRLGWTWTPLAAFLPIAWLGSGVGRAVHGLARWRGRAAMPSVRSSIARLMLAVGAIGLVLAAARNATWWGMAITANALAVLYLGAALRAGLGREEGSAWWYGFALVGGLDFLIWAAFSAYLGPFHVFSETPWPLHEGFESSYHANFVRSVGKPIPTSPMFDVFEEDRRVLRDLYMHSRAILMMGLSLPLGWLGGTVASTMDFYRRRRIATAGGSPCTATDSAPPP